MDDSAIPARVGRQLAHRRDDLDLTQEELAQRIGITSFAVSAAERGRNAIRRSKRADWEDALGLPAGSISRAYRDGELAQPSTEPTFEETLEERRLILKDPESRAILRGAIAGLQARLEVEDDPDERQALLGAIGRLGGPLPRPEKQGRERRDRRTG